jgi:hypothetical protein
MSILSGIKFQKKRLILFSESCGGNVQDFAVQAVDPRGIS